MHVPGSHFAPVASLVDGAYTENTGIAWAVAAGATHITSLLQGKDAKCRAWDMLGLFQASTENKPLVPVSFKIFQGSQDWALKRIDAFQTIYPKGNTTFLESITYGTIK